MIDFLEISKTPHENVTFEQLQYVSITTAQVYNNSKLSPDARFPNITNTIRINKCKRNPLEHLSSEKPDNSENIIVKEAYDRIVKRVQSEYQNIPEELIHYLTIPNLHYLTCAWCPNRFGLGIIPCRANILKLIKHNESDFPEYAEEETIPMGTIERYWNYIATTKDPLLWTKTYDQIVTDHPQYFERPKNQ
jgi:hypothetical protein